MEEAPVNKKNNRHNMRLVIIGILIVFSSTSLIILYTRLRLQTIALNQQIPQRGLVAVETLDLTNPQLSFYRLRDGQEQTVTGTFRYVFTQPHEVIVYGYSQEQPKEQHLFTLDDEKIRLKNISKLPGVITQINNSPNQLYLLISGITSADKKPYVCVVGRTLENFESCRPITDITATPSSTPLQAFWDGSKNAQLVIGEMTSSSPRTWLYYPSSKKIELVTSTASIIPPEPPASLPYTIHRLGPLVIATEHTKGKRYIFLTSAPQLLQLANGLLLALDDDKSFIINPEQRTISLFVPLPPRERRVISVF